MEAAEARFTSKEESFQQRSSRKKSWQVWLSTSISSDSESHLQILNLCMTQPTAIPGWLSSSFLHPKFVPITQTRPSLWEFWDTIDQTKMENGCIWDHPLGNMDSTTGSKTHSQTRGVFPKHRARYLLPLQQTEQLEQVDDCRYCLD